MTPILEAELTKSRPEEKLLAVPEVDVPDPAGDVEGHRPGKHGVDPVEQVEVGSERLLFKVLAQRGQILLQQVVVRFIVGVDERLVQQEKSPQARSARFNTKSIVNLTKSYILFAVLVEALKSQLKFFFSRSNKVAHAQLTELIENLLQDTQKSNLRISMITLKLIRYQQNTLVHLLQLKKLTRMAILRIKQINLESAADQ